MAGKSQFSVMLVLVSLGLLGILQGCGGGGSTVADSGTPTVATAGIALPTEVSAISTSTSVGTASLASQVRAVAAAVSTLPTDSDYVTTLTSKYVDEPTLEVFGIVETILKATAQTHYGDAANVGAGPYKAVVSWFDDEGGKSAKSLEDWVVQSDMIDGVNQVKVWIDDDQEPVKVQVAITTAPSQDADGSYLNYGEWTILAAIGSGSNGGTFYAKASIVGGQTELRMSEDFTRTENIGGGPVAITQLTKAIMLKSAGSGVGKASIADHSYCWDTGGGPSPCTSDLTLPTIDVQYAYNQDTLALDPGGSDPIIYKDRTSPVSINYNYGLFDATTGQNVEKVKQFGFPVTVDSDGSHGYYGAWQGRHQFWAGDSSAPADGTSVTKEVWDDSVAPTYTTKTYNGSLTKRSLVTGDLAQIQDIPVEIWMSDNFDLKYDSTLNSGVGGWKKCAWEKSGTVDGSGYDIWQESCSASTFDLTTLINAQDSRKHIDIGGYICDSYGPDTLCSSAQYDFNPSGFFEESQYSQAPGTEYGSGLWKDGDHLWINVNGSTYIVFNGTVWVEKTLSGFDNQTWTPTFASSGDISFDFPADREYYINNKGANFVVKRIATNGDAGDYEVKMEVQSVVRPDNAATVLSGISYFANEWEDASTRSTFSFDETTMLLKYATVETNDSSASVGDTLVQGSWGLVAFNASDEKLTNSDSSSMQFNWEYATQENPWGAITYLLDGNGDAVYLSDPIMLDPLALTPLGGGTALNFSLQFDGWMHGLPDMHWELEKSGFILNDNIKNKVVNIPAGTEVTDSLGGSYYIKPLEVGVILPILGSVPAGAPSPADAVTLDLDFTVPVPTDIGAMPTSVVTKYVEGVVVQ